jgi:hypothetical protein
MKTYLVECYLPRTRSSEFAEVATRLSASGAGQGGAQTARYVRSTYVPDDEICFHVFEAESMGAVREASLRVSLVFDRIVESEEHGAIRP